MSARGFVRLLVGAIALTIGVAAPVLVPAPQSPIRALKGTGNVAIGDVNNDRHLDLIATSSEARGVAVYIGQGNGQFVLPTGGALNVPESPHELALGDLNHDGNLDMGLASHDSYNVVLFLGDGRGSFRAAPTSPFAMKDGRQPHTHGLGITDFNGDGHADLVTVNSNDDNDVAVALGNGRGEFRRAPGSPFAVGPAPYPMALGDLDSDGRMDIVVTSTGLKPAAAGGLPANALTALFGDGRGGFKRTAIPVKTGRTWFVAFGDLNADGKSDLVTTHTEDRLLSVLLGDGRGNFTEPARSPFDLGNKAWYVALADLNRDRHLDVVAAAETGLRVMIGDGHGNFTPASGSPFATGKGTWRLASADVNADGKPDIAASNLESASLSLFLGQ
ncbi:MAG: VCBS repeat-containing protein [Vicinamibacterales bacterium]